MAAAARAEAREKGLRVLRMRQVQATAAGQQAFRDYYGAKHPIVDEAELSLALTVSWLLTRYFEEPLRRRLTSGPTLAADVKALLTAPFRSVLGARAAATTRTLVAWLPEVSPPAAPVAARASIR